MGAREALGLPADKRHVSKDTYEFFSKHQEALTASYDSWQSTFSAWKSANPALAATLQDAIDGKTPADLMSKMPTYKAGDSIATRNAGADCIQPVAQALPFYNSGSAGPAPPTSRLRSSPRCAT